MHPGAKARYHDQEVAVMNKIKTEREKGRHGELAVALYELQ